MKWKCAVGKLASITTNHINDIHLFLKKWYSPLFFFFFFLPAYLVPFFLNPVRETYNQVGMTWLTIAFYKKTTYHVHTTKYVSLWIS